MTPVVLAQCILKLVGDLLSRDSECVRVSGIFCFYPSYEIDWATVRRGLTCSWVILFLLDFFFLLIIILFFFPLLHLCELFVFHFLLFSTALCCSRFGLLLRGHRICFPLESVKKK